MSNGRWNFFHGKKKTRKMERNKDEKKKAVNLELEFRNS